MDIKETQLPISTTHPVYTLNELTYKTKNIWIVCHGYGQLARYFVKRFDVLDPSENFVVAPQGLSRFYLGGNYGKVGASWMTKESREIDLHNQRQYFDVIFDQILSNVNWSTCSLKLLGFSQGVTMISRLAVYRQLKFDQLILWAGGMPHEQTSDDWEFQPASAKIDMVIGDKDEFFNQATVEEQVRNVKALIGIAPKLTVFVGKHEVSREVLSRVVK
jgi:predicted esterase